MAELPGMEQNDIDLSLHDGMLNLKGEKKSESNGAHYSERWHGKFQRSLQVGPDLGPERVGASFRNGVLRPSALSEKQPQRFRALAQRLLRLAEGASRNATAVASPPHTMSQTMQLRHDEGACNWWA